MRALGCQQGYGRRGAVRTAYDVAGCMGLQYVTFVGDGMAGDFVSSQSVLVLPRGLCGMLRGRFLQGLRKGTG